MVPVMGHISPFTTVSEAWQIGQASSQIQTGLRWMCILTWHSMGRRGPRRLLLLPGVNLAVPT
jgi:hypothetical protein